MLSLGNAFDENDLINFKKILNYLDKDKYFEIEHAAEPKIDEFCIFNL